MGQINCQCQEVLLQHQLDRSRKNQFVITFSPQPQITQHSCSVLSLRNQHNSVGLNVREGELFTFGTSGDCCKKYVGMGDNMFKLQVKVDSLFMMVRDGSVGLGSFLLKKKVIAKKGREIFMSIDDYFLVVNLTAHRLFWKVFHLYGQQSFSS